MSFAEKIETAKALVAGGASNRAAAKAVGLNHETVRRHCTPVDTCIGPDCTRPGRHRAGLCNGHYRQWRTRGQDLAALTPLQQRTSGHRITPEAAELDVYEYEWMREVAGLSPIRALLRLDMLPVTVCKRYERLGRPVPAELLEIRTMSRLTMTRALERMAVAS